MTFIINASTAGDERSTPDVAIRDDGSFVVIWASNQDGTAGTIYARVFDSQANAISGEIQVNQTTAGQQAVPRVDWIGGNFVVVWQDLNQAHAGAYGRIFNYLGTAQGIEFALAATPSGTEANPEVTELSSGGFFAVWKSSGPNDVGYDIRGRQHDHRT